MITDREQLQTKKMGELRSMVTHLGMNWQKTEKKPELINRIIEVTNTAQPTDKIVKKVIEKKPIVYLKHEDVLDAIKSNMLSGLCVRFPDEISWEFKFESKSDSGSLAIPLGVIKRCADMVCR